MDRNNEIIVIHRAPSAPRLNMMGEEKRDINKKPQGAWEQKRAMTRKTADVQA